MSKNTEPDSGPSPTSSFEVPPRELSVGREFPRVSRSIDRSAPKQVVLALGGGAARAACHVGVVRAVTRARLDIVGVSGTSAGALVGGMLARGLDPQAIAQRFFGFSETALFRAIRGHYIQYLKGRSRAGLARNLYNETGITYVSESNLAAIPDELYRDFVEYFVGADRDLSSLLLPFATCAVDLIAGQLVSLDSGSLHDVVRGACAVPGLFPPQAIGERLCVDGSPASDLPIDAALRIRGEAPVLGVLLERPTASKTEFRNSAEVFCRYVSMVNAELGREQLSRLDFLIRISEPDCGWFSFAEAHRVALSAELCAKQALIGLLPRIDVWQPGHGPVLLQPTRLVRDRRPATVL